MASPPVPTDGKVLHVGCGEANPLKLHKMFRGAGWTEIRYDIDPDVKPDIIGSMTDMAAVQSGSIDAIWSSHNVEHLYAHEVPIAFEEFMRVLRPGGLLAITCPDIQSVCKAVADGRIAEPLYDSPAGPIFPLDVLYGHRGAIMGGDVFMAHRFGFTRETLGRRAQLTGFTAVKAWHGDQFDLFMTGFKPIGGARAE